MQFQKILGAFIYFALGCMQLALTSGCVSSSSHPLNSKPATQSQEAARIKKISNVPATDAWYSVQFVTENDAFLSMSKGLWRSIDGGSSWQIVHRAPGFWETIDRVSFLDGRVGWMETHNGWFKSDDGGKTWQPFVAPLSSFGRFREVKFINRKTGWIGGAALRVRSPKELRSGIPRYLFDDVTGKVFTPIIYRTDDSGQTWRVQAVPSSLGNIKDIRFLDSNHGIALSDSSAFQTSNGGTTWRKVTDPRTCIYDPKDGYEGRPSWSYLLDSSSQWIAFDDGRILRTTNGGDKWIELRPCDQTRPVVIQFASQNRGHGLGSDGFLYETTDGGKQWIQVGMDKYDSISFLDNQHVWLVSDQGLFRISLDR